MWQKRKLGEEGDSGGEGRLNYYENNNGRVARTKRRRFSIPYESSSTWFEEMFLEGGDEETRSNTESSSERKVPGTSPAIAEPLERDGEVIGNIIDYTESCGTGDKKPEDIDQDGHLYSPPSKKFEEKGLESDGSESDDSESDDSESETGSDEGSEVTWNYSNPVAEPARKIYLAPDRYAEYIAKVKKEEQLKKYNEARKKQKPWELRTMRERGPRAGRSDEFATEEEAQYAENIMRAAARHRLETWHRERHEMWGLKAIQYPNKASGEMEGVEEEKGGDSVEEDMQIKKEPDCGSGASDIGTLLSATSISQEDMEDDATTETVLQGIPGPLDPCFNKPANTIFLPRIPKFTEVAFSLEFRLGYTRKQVRWLMGGTRTGRGEVPSANTLSMRMKRYMEKNGLTDTVRLEPATAAARRKSKKSLSMGKSARNSDSHGDDDEERSGHHAGEVQALLPHGPRIPRPELGVHGWVWDHPHEEPGKIGNKRYY